MQLHIKMPHILVLLMCITFQTIQADIYQKILDDIGADDDPRDPKTKARRKLDPEHEGYKGHTIRDNMKDCYERDRSNSKMSQSVEALGKTIDKLNDFLNNVSETAGKESVDQQKILELIGIVSELKTEQKEANKQFAVDEQKGCQLELASSKSELDKTIMEKTDCLSNLQSTQSELNNVVEEKALCMSMVAVNGISYFKHFMRSIVASLKPVDGDNNTLGTKVILKTEILKRLQDNLRQNSNTKDILDIFEENDVFQPLEPSISAYSRFFDQLNMQAALIVLIIIPAMLFTVFYLRQLFFQEHNWLRQVIFIIFVSFLFSVPWEWYRMYRVELSKKASVMVKEIPEECLPKGLGVLKAVGLYFSRTFTFSDDKCVKYQESLLVDPLWEVTPLQAISVCLSRFFVQPMSYIAAAFGESFRVFFKEIPAQWQPFLFIALLIIIVFLIISFSSFRIDTPLLKINVNPRPEIQYKEMKNAQQRLIQRHITENNQHFLENPGKKLIEDNARGDKNDDIGVVDVGMVSCLPVLDVQPMSVAMPLESKLEEGAMKADMTNLNDNPVIDNHVDPGNPPLPNIDVVNIGASPQALVDTADNTEIDCLSPRGSPSESEIKLPCESDYQCLGAKEDHREGGACRDHIRTGINQAAISYLSRTGVSGILLHPDSSSVFSMPLEMGPSAAEIPGAEESAVESSECDHG